MNDDDPGMMRGGDNPFQDIGLPDADTLLIKADLAAGIMRVLRERQLGGAKAAEVAGVAEADTPASAGRRSTALRSTASCGSLNRLDRQVHSLTTFEKVEPGR